MKYIFIILFYLFYGTLSFAQNSDTTYYSVVRNGITIGAQKLWRNGSNEYHYIYYVNDRSSDSIEAVAQTDIEGLIVSLNATGHRNRYFESFKISRDSAFWTINEVTKGKKFNNQFYNSLIVPGVNELLINWLIKQPGKKGSILPERTIHTNDPTFKNISFNGLLAQLELYAIYSGTEPLPTYVWMTKDLHFFASVDNWTSVIRKGYESFADTLREFQREADMKYYRHQMKENAADIPSRLLIKHATLFHSSSGTISKDMTLEIVHGKISAIYSSSEDKKVKVDTVIDAGGKFLMPGLWDMHVHYGIANGIWYIAGGVTHVRDMGNTKTLLSEKREISLNEVIGPDISYTSGFIDKLTPTTTGPTGKNVSSLKESIEAIKEFHKLGYNQLKIYGSISPEWIAAMCAEAHRLGMPVSGHIPYNVSPEQAINHGFDELTHILFLFKSSLSKNFDGPFLTRFRLIGDSVGTVDLQGKQVQALTRLIKTKNIAVDPTLNVYAQYFKDFKGDTAGMFKPIINWLPDEMKDNLSKKTSFASEDKKHAYQSSYDKMLMLVKLLYDNNVMLLAGTDRGNATALHHELELYVQAGIPPIEVLKIATYNAAKHCGLENIYGEIKVGRAADFILIDGDPVRNISDIRRVEWVVKNGKVYNPKQLLTSQGWKYYY